MRKMLHTLVIVAAVLCLTVSVYAMCREEYFSIYCGKECDFDYGVCGWPNPDRVCWEYTTGGACAEGDINYASECSPGGCSF